MKSQVIKRSVVIGSHKTSVSLEEAFWSSLKEIAALRRCPCQTCSLQSMPDGTMGISPQSFASSCSTTIAINLKFEIDSMECSRCSAALTPIEMEAEDAADYDPVESQQM
jgi:hypothetical protein